MIRLVTKTQHISLFNRNSIKESIKVYATKCHLLLPKLAAVRTSS